MIEVDVYAVGVLRDWKTARRSGQYRSRARWFARSWRRRSYWNGFLAEHSSCSHNAGRGWTRRAALRRVERICERRTAEIAAAVEGEVQAPPATTEDKQR